MRVYMLFLAVLATVIFSMPQSASAERVVWQDENTYFGDVERIELEPLTFSDGITINQQNKARAEAAVLYGTKKLKRISLVKERSQADLVVKPVVKWWEAKKQIVKAHYETKTYQDNIYEPGHRDKDGKWVDGRSIKVNRQMPLWIPESSYYVHLVGIDYEVYDHQGKLVYSIAYDKSSSSYSCYGLLQDSSKDFFDELSDLKKDDKKKGPSVQAKIQKVIAETQQPAQGKIELSLPKAAS